MSEQPKSAQSNQNTPTRRRVRSTLADRVRAQCEYSAPVHFSTEAMMTMAYAIEQITSDRDPLELACFVDWATGRLLGRLGQRPGMPNETDLFRQGLAGIEEMSLARFARAFPTLTSAQR